MTTRYVLTCRQPRTVLIALLSLIGSLLTASSQPAIAQTSGCQKTSTSFGECVFCSLEESKTFADFHTRADTCKQVWKEVTIGSSATGELLLQNNVSKILDPGTAFSTVPIKGATFVGPKSGAVDVLLLGNPKPTPGNSSENQGKYFLAEPGSKVSLISIADANGIANGPVQNHYISGLMPGKQYQIDVTFSSSVESKIEGLTILVFEHHD